MIKQLIESHKFFMKHSGPYLHKWTIKNISRFPGAYIRFMYMCFKDYKYYKKIK